MCKSCELSLPQISALEPDDMLPAIIVADPQNAAIVIQALHEFNIRFVDGAVRKITNPALCENASEELATTAENLTDRIRGMVKALAE